MLSETVLGANLRNLDRNRPDPSLHGTFWVIAIADNAGAAICRPTFGKFSEKGIPFRLNSRLKQVSRALAKQIRQRIRNRVSTREINDGSVVHGGASC